MTPSATTPASETNGLLAKNDNPPSGVDSNRTAQGGSKRSLATFRLAVCLFLALIGILAAVTYWETHVQEWHALKLLHKYQKEADEALDLLKSLSPTGNLSSDELNDIPTGCETTVLIFRHCEDLGGHVRYADGTSHCSYLGFQRSLYLATLFGNSTGTTNKARWPLPSRLYGMWNSDGTNKRQYEMLVPLSKKADVTIQMFPFETAATELRDDLFGLLSSGTFCHQVVAVAWKHKFIRPLAAALGCDQERGCPDYYGDYDFDTVWELQFVYRPEQLQAYPQGKSVLMHSSDHLVDGWSVFGSATQERMDALAFKRDVYDSMEDGSNWMRHNHSDPYNGGMPH